MDIFFSCSRNPCIRVDDWLLMAQWSHSWPLSCERRAAGSPMLMKSKLTATKTEFLEDDVRWRFQNNWGTPGQMGYRPIHAKWIERRTWRNMIERKQWSWQKNRGQYVGDPVPVGRAERPPPQGGNEESQQLNFETEREFRMWREVGSIYPHQRKRKDEWSTVTGKLIDLRRKRWYVIVRVPKQCLEECRPLRIWRAYPICGDKHCLYLSLEKVYF